MKRNTLYAIVGVALVATAGLFFFGSNRGANENLSIFEVGQDVEADLTGVDPEAIVIEDFFLGDENAPVTFIEYASYTCPHCAAFHTENFKKLKAEYIDTGKIKFVNREVYFDRYGLWGAMIARCDGGEKYFGIVDMLYSTQRVWALAGDDVKVEEALYNVGRLAGMDDDQMRACMTDRPKAEALVAAYQKNAEADGISSTPTFVINGKVQPNAPWDEIKAVIDAALGE